MKRNLFFNFLVFAVLLLNTNAMMIRRGKYCKKRVVESYNLTSFSTFRN